MQSARCTVYERGGWAISAALDHAPESVVELPSTKNEAFVTTLLDLVSAVSDVSENEREVVATVAHMIRTGQVRLTGCFRNTPRDAFRV